MIKKRKIGFCPYPDSTQISELSSIGCHAIYDSKEDLMDNITKDRIIAYISFN
jgi:hypothetical protein